MKEANEKNEDERLRMRSKVTAIAEKLNVHCNKVWALVNGLEASQINKQSFSLNQTFYTTTSKVMTKAIKNLLETYETLRRDVRELAQTGYVGFENTFPELDVNFETYYSVAFSLLNIGYQMQLMRLFCYRFLKP
jgi:hypothetical protein